MTKAEYLEVCLSNWGKIKDLEGVDNLYELEQGFREAWEETGRQVFEKRVGKLSKDHRKKKSEEHLRTNTDR